jgi:circadian clock protein KaiB
VIVIYQEPQRAKLEQVVATPTLLKKSPGRRRLLIGDLSDEAAVMRGLDLETTAKLSTSTSKGRKREKAH